jgi:UDP-GlcNAc:undecaprenyl-phosphate GlcNAc-1-phosphate transferase
MDIWFYLSPFLISFFLAIVCIALVLGVFQQGSVPDNRQGERHSHRKGVLRFGGVALAVSFLVTIFTNSHLVLTTSWRGVIIVTILILIIGLWDDIKELSWKMQFMAQIALGSIAFAFGIRMLSFTNPFGGALFFDTGGFMLGVSFVATLFWILAVMNAVNWADGIDGLCGGLSFIGFVTIFILSLRPEVNQPPVAIFALTLAGSSLGFLVFNFYPARILAGTSGSWFLGFMLSVLALFSGTKIATAALVLALPLLDATWVVFERFHSGVSVFSPDKRHLHYRLQRIGWPPYAITAFLLIVTALVSIAALHSDAVEKIIILCVVIIAACTFFLWIHRRSVR